MNNILWLTTLAAASAVLPQASAHSSPRNIVNRQAVTTSSTTIATSVAAAPTVMPSEVPPLSSLTASMSTITVAFATPTAGAQPSLTGAPPLPTWSYTAGTYPAQDKIPPTNSSQVQGWINAIDWTKVPSYAANSPATTGSLCDTNTAAAADASRCWWSCGQCTTSTDIVDCSQDDTWGLTFDDGPSDMSPGLIDYLDGKNLKATFFVIGSRALGRPDVLRYEHMQGHEIAGHTWSHMPLTTLTNEEIVAELGWTKQLIKDIIGVETLTFRPPQGDMDNRVRAIASQMNLTPVMWTGVGSNGGDLFDTQDFEVAAGLINSTQAFSQWTTFLDTNIPKIEKGFLTLEHDLHAVTVNLAVYYYLPEAMNRTNPTLSLKTVMECNGRSIGEAYKETAQNTTTSAVASSSASASAASVSASTSASAVSGSSTRATASSASASASASSSPVSGAIWGTSVSAGLVGAVVALVGATALVL